MEVSFVHWHLKIVKLENEMLCVSKWVNPYWINYNYCEIWFLVSDFGPISRLPEEYAKEVIISYLEFWFIWQLKYFLLKNA